MKFKPFSVINGIQSNIRHLSYKELLISFISVMMAGIVCYYFMEYGCITLYQEIGWKEFEQK